MNPELEALLKQYSELLGVDLSNHSVYGSPMRPMSASWARIPDAVFMPCDKRATGHHTYIAVPEPLSQEVVNRYELKLVALGKTSL